MSDTHKPPWGCWHREFLTGISLPTEHFLSFSLGKLHRRKTGNFFGKCYFSVIFRLDYVNGEKWYVQYLLGTKIHMDCTASHALALLVAKEVAPSTGMMKCPEIGGTLRSLSESCALTHCNVDISWGKEKGRHCVLARFTQPGLILEGWRALFPTAPIMMSCFPE